MILNKTCCNRRNALLLDLEMVDILLYTDYNEIVSMLQQIKLVMSAVGDFIISLPLTGINEYKKCKYNTLKHFIQRIAKVIIVKIRRFTHNTK